MYLDMYSCVFVRPVGIHVSSCIAVEYSYSSIGIYVLKENIENTCIVRVLLIIVSVFYVDDEIQEIQNNIRKIRVMTVNTECLKEYTNNTYIILVS